MVPSLEVVFHENTSNATHGKGNQYHSSTTLGYDSVSKLFCFSCLVDLLTIVSPYCGTETHFHGKD